MNNRGSQGGSSLYQDRLGSVSMQCCVQSLEVLDIKTRFVELCQNFYQFCVRNHGPKRTVSRRQGWDFVPRGFLSGRGSQSAGKALQRFGEVRLIRLGADCSSS